MLACADFGAMDTVSTKALVGALGAMGVDPSQKVLLIVNEPNEKVRGEADARKRGCAAGDSWEGLAGSIQRACWGLKDTHRVKAAAEPAPGACEAAPEPAPLRALPPSPSLTLTRCNPAAADLPVGPQHPHPGHQHRQRRQREWPPATRAAALARPAGCQPLAGLHPAPPVPRNPPLRSRNSPTRFPTCPPTRLPSIRRSTTSSTPTRLWWSSRRWPTSTSGLAAPRRELEPPGLVWRLRSRHCGARSRARTPVFSTPSLLLVSQLPPQFDL